RAGVRRGVTRRREGGRRGRLEDHAGGAGEDRVRGETAVVRGGAGARPPTVEALLPAVRARLTSGERLKDAAAAVATGTAVSKRDLYAAAVAPQSGPAPQPTWQRGENAPRGGEDAESPR